MTGAATAWSDTALWGAAATSAATFLVHVFAGGAHVARPLLADRTLPRASKWLNYYCWHIVSVLIAAMAAAFAAAASGALDRAVAAFGHVSVLAGAFAVLASALSLLSAFVARKGGVNPLRFPSTSLFAAIAVLAVAAAAIR
jgi:hypothetical protein